MSEIIIYEAENKVKVEVNYENDTLWLSLNQIAELFDRDNSVISRHISNIFKEGELPEFGTVAKNAIVQKEGGRPVERKIKFYNLNVILAVGYRVSSVKGTQFRIWATQVLNEYLNKGIVIDQKRLEQKKQEIKYLKSGIQIVSRAIEEKASIEGYDWLVHYAKGLALLDDYDYEQLDQTGNTTSKPKYPSQADYQKLIDEMKADFDSAVFGVEKDKSFESAINQIAQGFGSQDVYPSIEEKAAMLLYLVIKNHAFADGNKRIAAACFLLFLERNKLLRNKKGENILSNEALAGLTLFVATSKPEEMETVKSLIVSVLNRNQIV